MSIPKRRKRWTTFLWGVSCGGELQINVKMSYSKVDVERYTAKKSNSKTYAQAVRKGWKAVRVRRTLSIEEEKG